jgi:UDP-glucose 4-epimerase
VSGGVLVVGSGAFIGRHLLPELAASVAVVATHRPGRVPPVIPNVSWIPSDLADAQATALWPARCDAVVFLAQSRAWREFPAAADDIFDVNATAVFRTLEYSRRAGVRHFVFASSGTVYPALGRPVSEMDAIDLAAARPFYAATKIAAEALISAYQQFFSAIVLRMFMPYGVGQHDEMLMPQLVRRVRDRRPIILDGEDGLCANPIAVRDVASAIRRCLSLDRSATLNVAGPDILTLRQIGHCIGAAVGEEPRFEHRAGTSAPFIAADTARLRAALGWAPDTGLATGLREWLAHETFIEPGSAPR